MVKILVIDDEKMINDLIAMNLQMVNYQADQAFDGEEALAQISQNEYDLALLDIMLPKIDGFELIPHLLERGIPVIYLTAKDSLSDKVQGLKLGADDYITKPFEALELLARIEAVLRRTGRLEPAFMLEDVEVNLEERRVTKGGQPIELTAQEFALLEVLIQHCNIAMTREQLLEHAWGYDYMGETRTVDIHIQRLRRKLEWDKVLQTVYKYGYRLEKKV